MENPRQNVSFPSNGSQAHGYLALPPTGTGPGLIVIQEWWGLTEQLARTVDQYAAAGFVALAPDLFGGRVAHDADEAGELMSRLDFAGAARDLAGAVDFLLAHEATTGDKVGAVGYCMGGGFVIALAHLVGDKLGAAVPFYGVLPEPAKADLSGVRAPLQGHFAENDDFAPPQATHALATQIRQQAGVDVDFIVHPGTGHAFCNDDNPFGTYDPETCRTATGSAVEFLRTHLT